MGTCAVRHALGIDRVTLYNKIKKFGLKKEDPREGVMKKSFTVE